MLTEIEKAEDGIRSLTQLASARAKKSLLLCTALFANRKNLYNANAVQSFLSSYDCLFPIRRDHPRDYREAQDVYFRFVAKLSLPCTRTIRHETVYYEFYEGESSFSDSLSLTLPIFEGENDFIMYSPENDTYQYGFYHYGKLKEGDPLAICPAGRLLIRKDTQKEKRPRLFLVGDALAPFLIPYLAQHFDICMHAPLTNTFDFCRDLYHFSPDVFSLIGGVSLLTDSVLSRALSSL